MSLLDVFSGLFGRRFTDLAIDLGTANTLVALPGQGVVVNEPSMAAVERGTNRVVAVGNEAKSLVSRSSADYFAVNPLRDGVVADYDVTEGMIAAFINRVAPREHAWDARPRVVVCIPCGATMVERRAAFEAVIQAGAVEAYLLEEPLAAALGAGLPVASGGAAMVVDIGGGTSEIAVIAHGGIEASTSLRLAGNRMDEAISMHLRDALGIRVSERTCEVIKTKIGSAAPFEDGRERDMIISGQDILSGQPKEVTIKSEDVRAALAVPCEELLRRVRETFRKTGPEVASDIIKNGILLTGGGGTLSGLDRYLTEQLEIPVHTSDTALTNVVLGCLKALEEPEVLGSSLARAK